MNFGNGGESFGDFLESKGVSPTEEDKQLLIKKLFGDIDTMKLYKPDKIEDIDEVIDKMAKRLENMDLSFDLEEMRNTLKIRYRTENNATLVKAIFRSAHAIERTFIDAKNEGRSPNINAFYDVLLMTIANLENLGVLKIIDNKSKK